MSQNKFDNKYGIISQRKLYINYEDDDYRLRVIATK
jgi:hypothetical protein